jgi:hypothetical protein
MARVLKAAAAYFGLVFAAGFALGVIREVWLKGMVGTRAAETAEVPIMIGASALAALWVARRFSLRPGLQGTPQRLAVGAIALVFLIAAELLMILVVRGQSFDRYLETRDAVAFPAYLVGLLCVALLPAIAGAAQRPAARYARRRRYS